MKLKEIDGTLPQLVKSANQFDSARNLTCRRVFCENQVDYLIGEALAGTSPLSVRDVNCQVKSWNVRNLDLNLPLYDPSYKHY